jgi:hypothetical protein
LVVVERGQIVEMGPHDELLERGGVYARLHRAQLDMHRALGLRGPKPDRDHATRGVKPAAREEWD